jgi:hypothetical protein
MAMSLRSHSPTILDQQQRLLVVNSVTTAESAAAPLKAPPSMLWPQESYIRLEFADFVDLQTRLVLLPRVEEEGRGAVVASYEETEQTPDSAAKDDASKENSSSSPHQNTAEPSKEHRDDDQGENQKAISKSVSGYSFVGLESKQEDWSEADFTDILARLRQETTPLTLVFAAPNSEQNEVPENKALSSEDTKTSTIDRATLEDSRSEATKEQSGQPAAAKAIPGFTSQESLQVGMSVLSSWGMRVRAQATEAASNISTVAKERAKNFQSPLIEGSGNSKSASSKLCNMFIQTSVGAFVPVAVAQSKVSTSSLLLVRKSATEAAPTSGWSYQWYRSSFANETWADETASLASGASRSTTSSSGATPETSSPSTAEDLEWIPLEGATGAAFQPNATLIGRKLRCIVTIETEDPASSDDSDCLDDADLASVEAAQEVCEINGVISADVTLFNASRQALARGAKFGGLKGRGNAAGRQFRVEISIGIVSKKRSRRTTCSLQIYQMSGPESVSLTPDPIFHASAHVPACSPKFMDLQIVVPPESVLSALCTDGSLQLETPNRLTRESFLMAMGVANYTGKPATLNATTIMFKDEAQQQANSIRSLVDEEVSVSSASYTSSVRSQGSARKVDSRAQSPMSPLGPLISPINTINTPGTPTNSWPGSPNRSLAATPESVAAATTSTMEEENRVVALERELDFLRGKLARKDKVVSELQRKIAQSDAAHENTQHSLKNCQNALTQSNVEQQRLSQSLQKAESYVKSHENKVMRLEGDHAQKLSNLEYRLESQSSKIADLEKANRSLQNEKAVLQATVEARESKLTRMAELQSSFEELSVKVSQHDALRRDLETSQKRYEGIQEDLRKVESVEKECRTELASAKQSIEHMTAQIDEEREKVTSCRAQLDPLQKQIQQLKGERNSYKQKNESLSKEVGKLCRNGRTIKDIEKLVADHQALQEEVETLRKQKRKALEDAHQYRMSYTQSKVAQELSGVETETRVSLERNAELERLLAEMTEYVNAKEMQLDTMKQVNEQLQKEIHSLAKANLGKNEV